MKGNENRRPSAEPPISAYLNSKSAAMGIPLNGSFELTARCNFNCRMCYVHQNGADLAARELPAAKWLAIAEEAKAEGMLFLLLTGGEPFLRPDFEELYTALVKMGFLVSINTNGSLYDEKLRALFLRYPPSRLNVTLYGGSEETYRRLCGNPSFETVVRNLRSMKADGLSVRLNVSLTPDNAGDMAEIERISLEIGLQAKASAYMYPPVRLNGEAGVNAARFSPEEAGRTIAAWDALRDPPERFAVRAALLRDSRRGVDSIADGCADDCPEGDGVLCRAGRSSFWITWDGKMMPCGTMATAENAPSLTERSFADCWNWVRDYTAAIRLPAACRVCPDRVNCAVCAAVCKGETGEFSGKPEYLCKMTKARIEAVLRLDEARKEKET